MCVLHMSNIELGEQRSKHRDRVKRLGDHKRRTQQMAAFVASSVDPGGDPRMQKLPAELHDCHNWLLFRDYYELGKTRLHRTISCRKHLLCPLCAILRAARGVRKYHERFEVITAAQPGLHLYYVVLTVQNGPDLKERFRHVEKHARRLVERRRAALKARAGSRKHQYALNSVFADVEGGAYSFEVKRGAGSGDWHPHINFLLLSSSPIDAGALSEEWQSMTGDSFITYCGEKPPDDKTAFVEVFKYALKFSEMELGDNFEAFTVLRGKHLFGSFGCFRGVKVPQSEDEAIDSPYVELVYRYAAGRYREMPGRALSVVADSGADAPGECSAPVSVEGFPSVEGEVGNGVEHFARNVDRSPLWTVGPHGERGGARASDVEVIGGAAGDLPAMEGKRSKGAGELVTPGAVLRVGDSAQTGSAAVVTTPARSRSRGRGSPADGGFVAGGSTVSDPVGSANRTSAESLKKGFPSVEGAGRSGGVGGLNGSG